MFFFKPKPKSKKTIVELSDAELAAIHGGAGPRWERDARTPELIDAEINEIDKRRTLPPFQPPY